MIIDCHTHIGTILDFDMTSEELLRSMSKYRIDFVIVSNIEGASVGHNQAPLPEEKQFTQLEISQKVVDLARKHPQRVGAALWIKPNEGCNQVFKDFVSENREFIYALKVHPYLNKTAFDAEVMQPYFELARDMNIRVVTHTSPDDNSHPRLVEKMAVQYPDVKFVLYHLGLGTDNEEAIDIVSRHDNLYGDVSWVKPESMLKAIRVCGADKIMFGTDCPINGEDTYNDAMFYDYCFDGLEDAIGASEYAKFMFGTAKALFGIEL